MKILLCCGGGFSSSAIATRMQKEIEKQGLTQEHSITFYPFRLIMEKEFDKVQDYDIAILCPHLFMEIQMILKKHDIPIPCYLLPPKIYGNMQLDVILKDCEDIIKIYHYTQTNPVHFPGEETLMKIKRNCAYRDTISR